MLHIIDEVDDELDYEVIADENDVNELQLYLIKQIEQIELHVLHEVL